MAIQNYSDIALSTTSSSASTLWSGLFNIVQIYIVPALVVVAIVGNALIVLFSLTPNAFSQHISVTVRFYYLAFAISDLAIVIFYNLLTWIGVFYSSGITLISFHIAINHY